MPRKFPFFRRIWIRQFCVCNRHKSRKLAQGKFTVSQGKHRENTGKPQGIWKRNLSGYPAVDHLTTANMCIVRNVRRVIVSADLQRLSPPCQSVTYTNWQAPTMLIPNVQWPESPTGHVYRTDHLNGGQSHREPFTATQPYPAPLPEPWTSPILKSTILALFPWHLAPKIDRATHHFLKFDMRHRT